MDRDTFLNNLRESGLLNAEEIAAVSARLPGSARARPLARALVKAGLLTKFQAELLLAGKTHGFVLGQYRILDQLGQGGMGRVYKALHTRLNRVVALKVLAPHVVRTAKARQLFHREVCAMGQLLHANIVAAHDANQINGRHFLVMEYIDGPNLDQFVRAHGALPIGLACEIIRQAAHGLLHAHECGMVHRDIKPANILLRIADAGWRLGAEPPVAVKITDFGLARLHDSGQPGAGKGTIVAHQNSIMGTPDFISPEQARNLHTVDVRSDLYSLGCTFYFLLTGQVPFPEGSSLEKLVRHTSEEPTPLEQLRPDLPADVIAIVRKLMAKNPDDRFQTPTELIAVLTPLAAAHSLADPFQGHPKAIAPFPSTAVAQEGTFPPNAAVTPLAVHPLPAPKNQNRWSEVRKVLSWAGGLVGGLVGLGNAVARWS